MKRWTIAIALLLIATACTLSDEPATTTAPPTTAPSTTTAPATTTTTEAPPVATSLPPVVVPDLEPTSFGELTAVPALSGSAYAGRAAPSSLGGVYIPDWVDTVLEGNAAKEVLVQNGFVVVPTMTRHFHHIYEGSSYDGYPVFVTTDAAYHVWHLAFDKILREAEQQSLLPILEQMLTRLVELARAQEAELAGTEHAEMASRVTQFYEAAATVLELDVGPIGPLAQQEVDLINAGTAMQLSPTTGGDAESGFITTLVDYSLFRPRGHYTRSEDLERYFRAMSQLGNNAFLLSESLPLGILASRVLLADETVVQQWRQIYEPTAWLVGAADDYTPFELGAIVAAAVPGGWSDIEAVLAADAVDAVGEGLLALRPVEINPEAASLRIMGSRFVIDSYIFDQLVMPNVDQRDEATPLDLASAFGSQWAATLLEDTGKTDFGGYDEQMAAMQQLIAERTIQDWGATVYDAWLYALTPMWEERGPDYPDFMRNAAWTAKAHQTGFSSYTELKHDTILYTKQAVAEGGGEEPPVPPRHWVEPEPVAFERLAAVTNLMREGLASRDLLPDQYRVLLTDLEDFYLWLAGIARDELAGLPISEEDNDQLSSIGSTLEGFWVQTSDMEFDWENGPDSHAALVADVIRNAEAVLELGTGFVDWIFVTVPDDQGGFQVATGGVYSYYEFWNTGPRLTDEEWRAKLDAGTQPGRPFWQDVFLPGGGTSTRPDNVTGLESGLFCRDLAGLGYDFSAAVVYWLSDGAPARMDADSNGIPCETVFPEEYESFLNAAIGEGEGKLCRDLGFPDTSEGYQRAVAYWMLEGAPVRMDADGNGVPCETVFSSSAVDGFFAQYGP